MHIAAGIVVGDVNMLPEEEVDYNAGKDIRDEAEQAVMKAVGLHFGALPQLVAGQL